MCSAVIIYRELRMMDDVWGVLGCFCRAVWDVRDTYTHMHMHAHPHTFRYTYTCTYILHIYTHAHARTPTHI